MGEKHVDLRRIGFKKKSGAEQLEIVLLAAAAVLRYYSKNAGGDRSTPDLRVIGRKAG